MTVALALAAAAVGGVVGYGTHMLNQHFATTEPEATEPPLPREALWAPVLDAALFGWIAYRFGLTSYALAATIFCAVMVQVLVFDARHRLILNKVMYPATFLALATALVNPLLGPAPILSTDRLVWTLLGAFVAGGVFLVIVLISRGGVGLGDAKLAFFLGAALGGPQTWPPPVLRALFLGIVLGGVGAGLLLLTRVRSMKDFIPYGPFLCAGAIITVLTPACGGATC